MDAVDDEAGAQPVVGKLVPDVIGMAAQDGVRAVAEVRGQRRSGAVPRRRSARSWRRCGRC